MCGFAGYLLKDSSEKSLQTIFQMLQLHKHRGPDDSGILGINVLENKLEEIEPKTKNEFSIAPNLIFGFNRLSIIDLSPAGHQPMINYDAQVALMMNGEVYNAFDFKPDLLSKGYNFKGNSDTEVVLNLYLEYGLNGMLERLNGMFAIAIYDGHKEELYLIRDRVGIKPLYVLQESNLIAFSSEMKSFKALPDFKFELDKSKLSEFLLFRNVINNTLFKNVVNISPGTFWTIGSKGNVQIKTYYDIRKEGTSEISTTKKDLEIALRNSVKRQMISDVKLGCQLSGGVDSSLVTAFAAESLEEGALETVSVVFDEKKFSEKNFIDKVADQYKLKSHQYTLDAGAYIDLVDEAIWHFEQPLNHPNTIGIKLLSREAKKHVTVLLSGEGADEALAGYSRFIPSYTKLISIETLKKLVKNQSKLWDFLKIWTSSDQRYIFQTAFGGLSAVSSLFPEFSYKSAIKSRQDIWCSIKDKGGKKKRKYELLTYLPDLLMRQDKMSMAHTIENRVPFLDNEMLSVSLSLEDNDLIKIYKDKWEGKFLLKEICSEIFGESFAFRNKMGFSIPLKSFFSSDSFQKRWKTELLPGIKKRGVFQTKPLEKWMKEPAKMNGDQLDAIWLMVNFEIWAKLYLD